MSKQEKEREKDEVILASILAGAALTERPLTPDFGYLGRTIRQPNMRSGPCCAVGAGVLYKKVPRAEIVKQNGPLKAFAKHYRVSIAYASDVSDGFEMGDYGILFEASLPEDRETEDYARGFAVGAAVRCSLEEVSDPVRAVLVMEGGGDV